MLERRKGGTDLALTLGAVQVNAYAIAWVILITSFANALSTAVFGAAPSLVITFVMHGLVMFAVMRTLLSGGAVTGFAAFRTVNREFPGAFILRLVLLTIPGILSLVLVSGILFPMHGQAVAIVVGLPVSLATQAAVLAIFGSMLPRIAEGKPGRASRALSRGQGHFRSAMIALLTGPALAELAAEVFLIILGTVGVPTELAPPHARHLSPVGLVVDIGFRMISVSIAGYYAAVLTRIYLEQRGPEETRPGR